MVSLESLSPFKTNYFDRDGIQIHYVDEGVGEPMVMLHGNPTWSYYYRDLIHDFSRTHRCIVPDHVGCGLSDKPPESKYRYTLASRASDLEKLLDHLEVKKDITLVVHDWGGMIGFVYAVCHPERIKRLIVLNTAAFLLPAGKRLPMEISSCRLPWIGEWLVRGFNGFCKGAARRCTVKPLSAESKTAYLAPYDNWADRVAIYEFVKDIPVKPGDRGYDLILSTQQSLDRLSHVPMLILWGKQDFVFDDAFLAEWRRRFPAAQVVEFSEAGHWLLEDASQDCIAAIGAFLKQRG